jgi:hypothetical protein
MAQGALIRAAPRIGVGSKAALAVPMFKNSSRSDILFFLPSADRKMNIIGW